MKTIKIYLKSFGVLTDAEIEQFIRLTSQKKVTKAEYFIREGETCKEVAFVLFGIFRSYYVSEKGEEFTYCITFPNN